jgi:hypothetical protein
MAIVALFPCSQIFSTHVSTCNIEKLRIGHGNEATQEYICMFYATHFHLSRINVINQIIHFQSKEIKMTVNHLSDLHICSAPQFVSLLS